MQHSRKADATIEWQVKNTNPQLARMLARECNIATLTAQVLINRGVYTPEAVRKFLYGGLEDLWSPFLMKDMAAVVRRINAAVAQQEKVLIYGDYDVDGMTATALLIETLTRLGIEPEYYLPNRADGYGLNEKVLQQAVEDKFDLVITVDCGITAIKVIEQAKEWGLDIIVTDHHEPGDNLPAVLTLNPKRADCSYPFKELAGVGVVFKLAQALLGECLPAEFTVYACLGTVADVMPLLDENRILVRHGLPLLTQHPGVAALAPKLAAEAVSARDVAFQIAPLLNAAGRVGEARLGVELLMSVDKEQAERKAEELCHLNDERRYLEDKISAEILAEVSSWDQIPSVLIFSGEQWNPGVTGIIASRLARNYKRPVFVVAVEGDEAQGSARSPEGFNLLESLTNCQQLLTRFGGHQRAAGFTLAKDNLEQLGVALRNYFEQQPERKPIAEIDAKVDLTALSLPLIQEIDILAPWGTANESPVFLSTGVNIVTTREVGQNRSHLQLNLRFENSFFKAIAFNMAERSTEIMDQDKVDLLYTPFINQWNGVESVELKIVDWRQAGDYQPESETESLEKTGFEFPESILRNWKSSSEQLKNKAKHCDCDMPSPTVTEQRLEKLYDFRHLPFWECYVSEYLRDKQTTAILVPQPGLVSEISALAREVCENQQAVHDYITYQDSEELEDVVELRVGNPVHRSKCTVDIAIIPVPYFTQEEWRFISQRVQTIILAPVHRQQSGEQAILQRLAPNRKQLLRLYRLLTSLGTCDYRKLLQDISMHAGLPDNHLSLINALLILEEMQLLRINSGVHLEVLDSQGRQNLKDSSVFQQVHQTKREIWSCFQFVMNASRTELAAFFECDIIALGDKEWQ